MISLRKVLLSVAMVAAALVGSMAFTAPAQAATYDGSYADQTGCDVGAYTARSAYGYIGGVAHVLVELRYSPSCRTTWARVTTLNMPNCVTNSDYCGGATVHRNSNGTQYSCLILSGKHGCYTRQVNDSGVTSYAHGWADDGANTAYATTSSF